MTAYQFQFTTADGRRPSFTLAECADDAEAALLAMRALADHPTCSGVEVWRDTAMVASLEKPSPAAN